MTRLAHVLHRLTPIMGLTIVLLVATTTPHAQISSLPCGGKVDIPNTSSWTGTGLNVQYTVSTMVPMMNVCTARVYVDTIILGVTNSTWHAEGTYAASAQRIIQVPKAGTYVTNGTHRVKMTANPVLLDAGLSQSTAVVPPPPLPNYDPVARCEALGGRWDGFRCILANTPILIDVGGRGYKLTDPAHGVVFDMDGDGVPEHTAWTARDAENAFLALDRNGNGTIDNGTELFGAATPVRFGVGTILEDDTATTANGFEALKFYQVGEVNGNDADNETVTPLDQEVWPRLLLWTDRNHDGVSQPDELLPMARAGIKSISLDYHEVGRRDQYGNTFRQMAKITWANGRPDLCYDVWFLASK